MHNFIQPRVVCFLNLHTKTTQPLCVMVDNGSMLDCHQIFPATVLCIEGHTFIMSLRVLPICNADVVLGIVWIKLLGPVITDYTTLTIKFNHLDIPVQLNADVTNGPTSTLFQLTVTQTSAPDPDPLPAHPIPDIQYLLDTYSSIFTQPSTLPPPRAIEHHINL